MWKLIVWDDLLALTKAARKFFLAAFVVLAYLENKIYILKKIRRDVQIEWKIKYETANKRIF